MRREARLERKATTTAKRPQSFEALRCEGHLQTITRLNKNRHCQRHACFVYHQPLLCSSLLCCCVRCFPLLYCALVCFAVCVWCFGVDLRCFASFRVAPFCFVVLRWFASLWLVLPCCGVLCFGSLGFALLRGVMPGQLEIAMEFGSQGGSVCT